MEDPAEVVHVRAAHGLLLKKIMGHKLDAVPQILRDGRTRLRRQRGLVLHDAAQGRPGARGQGHGGGADGAAEVDEGAHAAPVEGLEQVPRGEIGVGVEELHELGEACGALGPRAELGVGVAGEAVRERVALGGMLVGRCDGPGGKACRVRRLLGALPLGHGVDRLPTRVSARGARGQARARTFVAAGHISSSTAPRKAWMPGLSAMAREVAVWATTPGRGSWKMCLVTA